MSGVRQHFIPRFLQKGFKIPGNGKVIRSWIYERHRETWPANIKTIGFEGHFYAVETESDLDDRISKAEEEYSPLVERLRRGELDGESTREIPALLAHFEIRSRHVRKNMESASVACVSYLMQRLADPMVLTPLLRPHLHPDSPAFAKLLGSREMVQLVKQSVMVRPALLEEALDHMMVNVVPQMISMQDGLRAQIGQQVKRSHIRVMMESISPDRRADRFRSLAYSVKRHEAGDLPLGDSIVLFQMKGGRQFSTFLDKDDELIRVVLPLSPDQYLEGVSGSDEGDLVYDLPAEIARCSMDYFIASSNTPHLIEHRQLIGSNAHWVSEAEVNVLMEEVIQKLLREVLN